MQLPNGSVWPCKQTKKKSKTGEDGSYQTAAQIGLGDRGRKKAKNGLDLIWIEIGVLKIQGMSSLAL